MLRQRPGQQHSVWHPETIMQFSRLDRDFTLLLEPEKDFVFSCVVQSPAINRPALMLMFI